MEMSLMENMTYKILDKVNSPADIKTLDMDGLRELCAEIRHYMIECCSVNPGHLGSSLGAVELVVALHYVYDAPEDKLVFDVGHQAYAHKIITGRREAFRKNRMKDGISGFPKRSESEYDAFGAGHSSTSVSAALGFAEAAKLQGLDQKVIALIGDGSLTGGLALEGLNNAGASKSDILVILNDNNISIDRNIGALHEYLLKITTDPRYNQAKKRVWDRLGDGPFRRAVQRVVTTTKSHMVSDSGGDLFQAMGFRYFGPIDGNDIAHVVDTLQRLKSIGGPLLLHTLTKKGKGYAPAEANQTVWHAPGHSDPETGERVKDNSGVSRYQDVFGEVLLDLARENERIVGVTPAMASGCGMNIFRFIIPKSLVEYITDDSTVRQGFEKMRFHRYVAIPVLDGEGKYVGMLRNDDILQFFLSVESFDVRTAEKTLVADVIDPSYSKPLYHHSTMAELLELVKEHNSVPVVDDRGCFIGIVLRRDVMNFLLKYYTPDKRV